MLLDCFEGSISAESETSPFPGNNLPALRRWECISLGLFFIASALSAGMDGALCNFPVLFRSLFTLYFRHVMLKSCRIIKRWIFMKDSGVIFLVILFVAALSPGCAREGLNDAVRNGQVALYDGKYEEAVPHLKRVAALAPEEPYAHYNLGMAYLMLGKNSAAAKAFERAAELSAASSNTDALEALGEARRRQKRFSSAKSAYEQAMSRVGRHGRLLAGLAACEMAEGRNEYALSLLQEALRDSPENPAVLFNMALLKKNVSRDLGSAAGYYIKYLLLTSPGEFPEQDAAALRALAEIHEFRDPEVISNVSRYVNASRSASDAGVAAQYAYGAVMADPTDPAALLLFIDKLDAAGRKDYAEQMRSRYRRLFPGALGL